jgi:hypothetical protein
VAWPKQLARERRTRGRKHSEESAIAWMVQAKFMRPQKVSTVSYSSSSGDGTCTRLLCFCCACRFSVTASIISLHLWEYLHAFVCFIVWKCVFTSVCLYTSVRICQCMWVCACLHVSVNVCMCMCV